MPASAKTNVYAADWEFCGMFLKPTASVPSTVQELNTPLAGVPSAGVVRVGEVKVLLVSVSEPAKVAKVPVVGKVTFVTPVSVRVYAKLPEPVTVMAALFETPVPPLAAGKAPVTWDVRSTPDNAPPNVKLPEVVTEPEREIPLTVPVPPTLVIVPPVPVALIV